MLLAASLTQRITAILMIACVSICCCHAHSLTPAPASEAPIASPDFAVACCGGCADGGAGDDGGAPVEPPEGCEICCVKGDGLKHGPPALPDSDLPAETPALPALVVLLPPAATALRHVPPVDQAVLRVEPPTLLRLRCALLV